MSKRITDEKLNVEMSINGVNKTQAEISKIQTSIRGLKNENEDLAAAKRKLLAEGKRESKQYKELTEQQRKNRVEIDRYEKKQKDLQKQLGLTGMTMRQLEKNQKSLRSQMKQFVPNTPEWDKLNRELKETDKRLGAVRNEMRETGGVMSRMKKSIGGFGALFLGGFSIGAIIQGGKKLVGMNSELSDSQANVAKTTGLAQSQIELLTRQLKTFDTRTPVNELLALAEEAGRLGKDSVEDVMGFVKTADMLRVALGDDLQGDINENIQLIGKLSTQYRVSEKYQVDFGRGMEMIGSAINEVAASGANQAGFLVDYMKRLVGISAQTGITADQQLGFAAALDEAGQSVEVSGTTMSRVIMDMYGNASEYAKIAGIDTVEFSKILKEDANEALLLFLEGLQGNNEGMEEMVKKMDGLKLEGARSAAVLTTLAANTDNVRAKQEVANKAIEEGTSLTEEFNVKNANLAGNIEKLGNMIGNYFKNSELTGWLTKVTGGMLALNKETNAQSNLLREQQFETNILVGSITSLNGENDARDRLLKELQKTYPDFLGNLDAEKVTNEQLRDRLSEVNAEYREKIRLAAFGEMIAENESKAIKLQREENERIINIEKMRAASNVRRGKTLEETVELIRKEADYGFIAKGAALGAEKQLNRIHEIRKSLNELEKENINLQKEKNSIDVGGSEETNTNTDDPDPNPDENPEVTEQQKAAREKRLQALATLQEKYDKLEEDRLAESFEAKAKLERDRALEEAQELQASEQLLQDIRDEWQVKIDEGIAQDEEKKLQNRRTFEERKRALENELALQRAEDEEERDLLAEEQRYEQDQERLERELEQIQVSEDQKNYLRQLLKEHHEASITEIEARHAAERFEQEKDFNEKSIRATQQLEAAKSNALQQGLNVLSGFFGKKTALYKGLFLLEKGAAISQVANQGAKALGEITASTMAANAKAASASPLTMGQPWVTLNTAQGVKQAAAVKLNTALQIATIGASAIQGVAGFEDGLYPDYLDVTRKDGKRFNAINMGRAGTRIVSEPSYFTDNGGYLAAENGTEMIIDNGVFRQLDPGVVDHIMQVNHRVNGYESGMYKGGSSSGSNYPAPTSDPELKAMIAGVMNLLQNPPSPILNWGYDQTERNRELEQEMQQSSNNGKITS